MKTVAVADTAAISTEAALAIFDSLDPIEVEAMFGPWKGSGFPTHHPLDGALEAYHWHSKRFDSAEHVHPLVFDTRQGGTVCVNPLWLLPLPGWIDRWPIPKSKPMGHLGAAGHPALRGASAPDRLSRQNQRHHDL